MCRWRRWSAPPESLESPAQDQMFQSYVKAQSQTAAALAAVERFHLELVMLKGGRPQDAMLDVAAVVLGQKGLTDSGCQSGLGQPDCLPGWWLVVRYDHSCEHKSAKCSWVQQVLPCPLLSAGSLVEWGSMGPSEVLQMGSVLVRIVLLLPRRQRAAKMGDHRC